MIFLIEYNRPEGRIVTFKAFEDSDAPKAEKSRLKLELSLHRKGIDHEVVILQAESEKALRKTHRRYFPDFSEHVRAEAARLHDRN